jgi:hypothetical protein
VVLPYSNPEGFRLRAPRRGNITHLGDAVTHGLAYLAAMLIKIWRETERPLVGRVAQDEEPPRTFEGWLQLLRILADLLEPGRCDGPRHGGSELDP